MRLIGRRQLLREAALQSYRRQLRGELDDDDRISEATEQVRAVIAASDEQEGQPRREPQDETEEVGAAAFGQSGNVVLFADGRAAQCAAPQFAPVPISIPDVGNATPELAAVQEGDLMALNAVDTPPIAVERPAPQYTPLARTRRQEGTVVIDVLVDERGKVIDTRLVRGIPASDLNEAAVEAVKRWTYRPAIKDGVAVKVWRPEQIRFKL